MNRHTAPLFLRVSIGLGLATAVLTSAARANPSMFTNLGIGVHPNPATSAQLNGSAQQRATGRSSGAAVKPSAAPVTRTAAPRIGKPVTEQARPSKTQRPEPTRQPSKSQLPSKAEQAEQSELAAISAAAKTERSSWSQVQELVKQRPTLADTPLYQEIVQFQKTVPTPSELTAAGSVSGTKASGVLSGQSPKERQLLLQKLTTQNVVLQTLLVQAGAANLDG